jgi:hypothetical protein
MQPKVSRTALLDDGMPRSTLILDLMEVPTGRKAQRLWSQDLGQ